MMIFQRFSKPYKAQQRTPLEYLKCFVSGIIATIAYPQNNLPIPSQFWSERSIQIIKNQWKFQYEYGVKRILSQMFSGGIRFGFYDCFKRFYEFNLQGTIFQTKLKWLCYSLASFSAELFSVGALFQFKNIDIFGQKQMMKDQPKRLKPQIKYTSPYQSILTDQPNYKGQINTLIRNIPYSVIAFTSFEVLSQFSYSHILKTPKQQYNGFYQVLFSGMNGFFSGSIYFLFTKLIHRLPIPIIPYSTLSFVYYSFTTSYLFTFYNIAKITLNSQALGGQNKILNLH